MSSSSGTLVTPPAVTPTTASAAIKHVVVIFGENISFDHYFGTYPNSLNSPGEPAFTAAAGTPIPNNYVSNPSLLSANPNLSTNGVQNATNAAVSGAINPFRLTRAQNWTASQDHNYNDEQKAFDANKMDAFPAFVGTADNAAEMTATNVAAGSAAATKGLTMGYFDGNTVTAMWNYAQHYALNDHSFGSNFGPSTVGALNLISGQTNGVTATNAIGTSSSTVIDDGSGTSTLTVVGDPTPGGELCPDSTASVVMNGLNVGDLLTKGAVSWGWFQGGFDTTITNPNGSSGCTRSTVSAYTGTEGDYSAHHEPFQYYPTTRNLNHTRPTPGIAIGAEDKNGANHQYDINDFNTALAAGQLASVSFLKAPKFQDAHAGNSEPLDEQAFVVNEINSIQKSQFWSSTAIIIAYDDSDGWYDHLNSVINGSTTSVDFLNGTGVCISAAAAANAMPGVASGTAHAQGRCGYGPRLPLMVISPWAKKNYIDSTVTDQSSITRFIEDTFVGGQRIGQGSFDSIAGSLNSMFDFSNGATAPNPNVVVLNPSTGVVTSGN